MRFTRGQPIVLKHITFPSVHSSPVGATYMLVPQECGGQMQNVPASESMCMNGSYATSALKPFLVNYR